MEVPELLAQQPCRYALERADQIRQRNLRWEVNQQMNMVVLAIELHQFGVKVMADIGEDSSLTVQQVCENFAKARKQFKLNKLCWRVSNPQSSKYSLGWIPFKTRALCNTTRPAN